MISRTKGGLILLALGVVGLWVIRGSKGEEGQGNDPAPQYATLPWRENLRAAFDPSLATGHRSTSMMHAAYSVPPADAATDEWRHVVLQAVQDPALRGAFFYCCGSIAHGRYNGLLASGNPGAAEDVLQCLEDIRQEGALLSSLQKNIVDYYEGRILRASARTYQSLEIFDAVTKALEGFEPQSAIEDSELGRLAEQLSNERVRNLLEVGLQEEALRAAVENGAGVELEADIYLYQARPEAALQRLEGHVGREKATLMRGVAHARLAHTEEAHILLEAVIRNDGVWPSIGTSPRGNPPRFTSSMRERAALVLAEMEVDQGRFKAAAAALDLLPWPEKVVPLHNARMRALRAFLAIKTGRSASELEATRSAMLTAYDAWIAVWKNAPAVHGGIRFLQDVSRVQLLRTVLAVELDSAQSDRSALVALLKAQACGTLARQLGDVDDGIEALEGFVEGGRHGVVIALPLRRVTHLFVVDHEGVKHFDRSTRAAISDATPDLLGFLESRERSDEATAKLRKYAASVTKLAIGAEVMDRVSTWDTATFVGLDRVTHLPPALLLDNGGHWLGTRKVVAEWPSVPVGLAMVARPKPNHLKLHALIDPVLGGPSGSKSPYAEADPLQFSEEERSRLVAALGGNDEVHSGADASLDQVDSGPASLLYVHCHGRLVVRARRQGRLLLAGTRATSAEDIEECFTAGGGPSIVLLAACRGAWSRLRLGEDGSGGLCAAFVSVGARSILAPRRDIYHLPTKALCLDLVEGLGAGLSLGEALKRYRFRADVAGWDPRDATGLRLYGAFE